MAVVVGAGSNLDSACDYRHRLLHRGGAVLKQNIERQELHRAPVFPNGITGAFFFSVQQNGSL